MINSDHSLAGPNPGQGLPVVWDLNQKVNNKIPKATQSGLVMKYM
jgi:hypothetical protein